MSLSLHKTSPVESTTPSPPLFHHEGAKEKDQFTNYNGNIYLQSCDLLFHFSVSFFQKCSLV
jgi:hypothetical protein